MNFCCVLYKTISNQIFIELLEFVDQDFKIIAKLPIKIIDFTMKIQMFFNQNFTPCAVLIQDKNVVIINFVRYEVFVVAMPETDEERERKVLLYRQQRQFDEDSSYLIDTYEMLQNINVTFVSGAVIISKQLLDKNKYYTVTIAVNPIYKTGIIFSNINELCSYDQEEFLNILQLSQAINQDQLDKITMQQKINNVRLYISNYFSRNNINFYKPLQQNRIISPFNFIPQSFIQQLNDNNVNNNSNFNYNDINQYVDLDQIQDILSKMSKKFSLGLLQSSDDSQINSQVPTGQMNSILADASQSIIYQKPFEDIQQEIKLSPPRLKMIDQFSTSQSYADIDKQDIAFKYLRPIEQNQVSDDTIEKINQTFKFIPFSRLIDYRDCQQRYQQIFYDNQLYVYDFLRQTIIQVYYETSPVYLDNSINVLQFYTQCPYSYSQMIEYQQIKQQIYFSTLFQSNFLSSTSMCQSMSNDQFLQQIAGLCSYQNVDINLITKLIASRSIVNVYQAMQSYNLKLLKQFCSQLANILMQANQAQKSSFTTNQIQQISITKIIKNEDYSNEYSLEAADFQCQYLPQSDGFLFDLNQMGNSQEIESQKQSLIFKCQKLKADFKYKTYQPYQDSINSNIKRYKIKTKDQLNIYDTSLQLRIDTPLYEAFYKLIQQFCQITNQSINKEMINLFYSILSSSISNAVELFSFGLKQIYQQQIYQDIAQNSQIFKIVIYLSEFVENIQITVGNSYRSLIDIVLRNNNCQKLYEQLYSQSIL